MKSPNPVVAMMRTRLYLLLALLPLLFILSLFVISLVELAYQSLLKYVPPPVFASTPLSILNYIFFLTSTYYVRDLRSTLVISAEASLFALLLAMPIAYRLTRPTHGRWETSWSKFLSIIVMGALFLTSIPRAFAWFVVLASNGPIGAVMLALTGKPYTIIGTSWAVVFGITAYLLPFATLSLIAGMRNITPSLIDSAKNLGASDVQTFVYVIIPLSLPAIAAVVPLLFTLATAAFVPPLVLGGGIVPFLSVDVYDTALQIVNEPLAATISIIFTAVALLVVLLSSKVLSMLVKKAGLSMT